MQLNVYTIVNVFFFSDFPLSDRNPRPFTSHSLIRSFLSANYTLLIRYSLSLAEAVKMLLIPGQRDVLPHHRTFAHRCFHLLGRFTDLLLSLIPSFLSLSAHPSVSSLHVTFSWKSHLDSMI